jgi:hypothetical protein
MRVRKLEPVRENSVSVMAYAKAVREGWNVVPSSKNTAAKIQKVVKTEALFDDQQKAIEHARKVALKYQSGLSLSGKNGRIKTKFIEGEYNFPPRG